MLTCVKCQHNNFDGLVACSRCGSPISVPAPKHAPPPSPHDGKSADGADAVMGPRAGVRVASGLMAGAAGFGAGGGAGDGLDEYQRLMAARAAKQKRNRVIFTIVALAVVGGGGAVMVMNNKKAKAAQEILEAGGRFAERDKQETGAFWNCIVSSDVDVGNFKGVDEIQMRVESAYFTQQKTFSDHLTTECVPKIERARSAMGGLASDFPPGMKEALDKYLATLPRLQSGIESYAEKVKGRSAVKDVDGSIQEVGTAFTPEPTAESVAFEKFLACAIPDLDKKKDIQEVLEFLASTCKTDAVKFMTRVREQCGPLVQSLDKDAKAVPTKTFKVNAKKFYEEDQRQLQAWEYCGKRSRKGKKVLDLQEFLNASGDYMEARAQVAQATRETAARITGTAIEAPKKKDPAAPAGPPPPAAN
jgi:hypothetical protein